MGSQRQEDVELWGQELATPLGRLWLLFSPRGLRLVRLTGAEKDPPPLMGGPVSNADPALRRRLQAWVSETIRAFQEYFAGPPQDFSHLSLDLRGTPFQRRVWEAARQIPFGATISYGALVHALGLAKGARALGGALRANPLLIIIPCHRIISADGSLGGFSAGLSCKRSLLAHEQAVAATYLGSGRGT